MTWFFASPFMCLARTAALQNDYNLLRYPACGVLYGKSNAGKTDLTKVLLRAMFGQEWWLDSRDFNATNFTARPSVAAASRLSSTIYHLTNFASQSKR